MAGRAGESAMALLEQQDGQAGPQPGVPWRTINKTPAEERSLFGGGDCLLFDEGHRGANSLQFFSYCPHACGY